MELAFDDFDSAHRALRRAAQIDAGDDGLRRRRLWGYRLAIAALAINFAGDLINGIARDPRSLAGVPIVSVLLGYLLRPSIRNWFRPHRP